MEDKALRKKLLEAQRMGMKKYIIMNGVVRWGLGVGSIYRILSILVEEGFLIDVLLKGLFSLQTVFVLGFFAVLGALWGLFMWKWIQRQIEKLPLPRKRNKK